MEKIKNLTRSNSTIIPYKIDKGSDGNIKPIYIFKILYHRAMKEQLAAAKNKKHCPKKYKNQQL